MDTIRIRGARTHNLQNINLDLPRDRLIVITGLSGSGKSSLAFDTIYAEGQRRYVESLSSYARQFLSVMEKPPVDSIEGLSPAISIQQKTTSHNPRSTVGTVTEIYDYLRLLFARAGTPQCPIHHCDLEAQTVSQMVDIVMEQPADSRLMLLAPIVQSRKGGEYQRILQDLRSRGFVRARIDGQVMELEQATQVEYGKIHEVEVVVDRFKIRPGIEQRLADSLETALNLSDGVVRIAFLDDPEHPHLVFSARYSCPNCGYSLEELETRLFSFNNPTGACPHCDGLGIEQVFDEQRIAAHPELSLAAGAVRGWDRRNVYYYQLLTSLAKHLEFDLDTPFNQLEPQVRHAILYGTQEPVEFYYHSERGGARYRRHPFEGIIPNMQRRYRETESSVIRDELAKYLANKPCQECQGTRLRIEARNVLVCGMSITDVTSMAVGRACEFFSSLVLPGKRGVIAGRIVKEISQRLDFLVNVGLDYLTLDRSADTLSGGETQRIRLASQIGAGLVGVMYVLDEPSIGLHQRDNERLINTLKFLRDIGNTVIVVEHDEEAIRAADQIVDIGPGAGIHGGRIVAQGTPAQIEADPHSLTGRYLSGALSIHQDRAERRLPDSQRLLHIRGASGNNLKGVNVDIPAGLMTVLTGVSGSGKSTLLNNTLYRHAMLGLHGSGEDPAPCAEIVGLDLFDKVIGIDQSPIGRTPRSNPATYTGLFTPVRELFAATKEAKARGYTAGRFSFNVRGGRCEACQGDGLIKVEMHFLPDIYVPCDVCKGKRYSRETLEIHYKGRSIHDVLEMTVEEARIFFDAIPAVARKLQTLIDVGLSYVKIGQNATTLSGGEAQRIKLSRELSKRDTGNTLYILDEPTTGLHFHDVKQLLSVLHRLRNQGNTIVIIEHNLDVIKSADWIVDLGPEGGDKGGELIVAGAPETVAAHPSSYTGRFLKAALSAEVLRNVERNNDDPPWRNGNNHNDLSNVV